MKFLLSVLFLLQSFFILANDTSRVKITLPAGFHYSVVADNLGRARHIAVNTNGDVYVKLERLKDGKGIYRLRDTNGDGQAEDILGFGNYIGTGMAVKNGFLYASSNSAVYRYKLDGKGSVDTASAVTVSIRSDRQTPARCQIHYPR